MGIAGNVGGAGITPSATRPFWAGSIARLSAVFDQHCVGENYGFVSTDIVGRDNGESVSIS